MLFSSSLPLSHHLANRGLRCSLKLGFETAYHYRISRSSCPRPPFASLTALLKRSVYSLRVGEFRIWVTGGEERFRIITTDRLLGIARYT
ncbi:unnamed protein product [Arabis nemorensis]|uniref:Uncharacterized protein n=1 Tax=Arabis nemorensis TaxID=586526 RepID=A0A565B998_9BRAS|nr:unnamed protein product [Arabis nemorensis]